MGARSRGTQYGAANTRVLDPIALSEAATDLRHGNRAARRSAASRLRRHMRENELRRQQFPSGVVPFLVYPRDYPGWRDDHVRS